MIVLLLLLLLLLLLILCYDVCLFAESSAVRLAFSEVTERLYYTDWQNGSINVIDVRQQSDTTPRPVIAGLNNPLPITAHPHNRSDTIIIILLLLLCR